MNMSHLPNDTTSPTARMAAVCERLKKHPDDLAYQSAQIKDNEQIVRTVLQKEGRAFVYVSERLRNDLDLIRLALSSPMQSHERAAVLVAIGSHVKANKYAMLSLCASCRSVEPLYVAHPSVLDDFETMLACARIDARCLMQASERLRSDLDFALAVAQHNPKHLFFMASCIRQLPEVSLFEVHMDGQQMYQELLARKHAKASAAPSGVSVTPRSSACAP